MRKFTIVAVVCTLFLLTACSPSERIGESGNPILKIGYLPITHAGPLYLDAYLSDGVFETYEIEMVKFGSWPDLMDALNTGRIDGASVLIELAMKAKELGIDLRAVALGHQDGNVLVSAKEVKTTADLIGETYAIPHKFSSQNILLNEMLKKDGLSYEDVNVVEMTPAEMPAALAEKRIAGYVVAEPFGALAVAMDKGKVHYHSDEIWPNSYCCILVLRNDVIEKHYEIVQSFVSQYVNTGKLADQKGEELYESFAAFMKVEKEVLDLSLKWISFDNLRIEEEEYDKLANFMIEMGMSDNPPIYEEFVDNTFIDEAK